MTVTIHLKGWRAHTPFDGESCDAPGASSRRNRVKMDVIKREEAKRVASGRGHFRATSEELGLRVCTK